MAKWFRHFANNKKILIIEQNKREAKLNTQIKLNATNSRYLAQVNLHFFRSESGIGNK